MRPATGNVLETRFDHKLRTLWITLPASPSFLTPELLRSIQAFFVQHGLWPPENEQTDSFYGGVTRYVVLTVRSSGIFTLGTPLQLFQELVESRDREALLGYATSLVDTLYPLITGFGRGISTVCLAKGRVLSTGVDLALSCHYLVAERNASFGLPELLYNMPGIAAFGLLARRIGAKAAEAFLRQAREHSAAELVDTGIIDRVVAEGSGANAVRELIESRHQQRLGEGSLYGERNRHWQMALHELYDLARQWADTATTLGDKDLRRLERYMRSQMRWRLEQSVGHQGL
jgi:DSF synthase